ncbi:MAG: hypothetical protein ACI4UO_02300, partial [Paludibacteraceae bacterium]
KVEEDIEGIPISDAPVHPQNGMLYERQFEILPEMIYYVDFLSDSTAAITHVMSNTDVGYSGNTLQQNDAPWYYRLLPDSTIAFFVPRDASRSWLLTTVYDDNRMVWKGDIFSCKTEQIAKQALLYEADFNACFTHWTSYPYGQGIERTDETLRDKGIEVQIGTLRLSIRNGKKYLSP